MKAILLIVLCLFASAYSYTIEAGLYGDYAYAGSMEMLHEYSNLRKNVKFGLSGGISRLIKWSPSVFYGIEFQYKPAALFKENDDYLDKTFSIGGFEFGLYLKRKIVIENLSAILFLRRAAYDFNDEEGTLFSSGAWVFSPTVEIKSLHKIGISINTGYRKYFGINSQGAAGIKCPCNIDFDFSGYFINLGLHFESKL
jgi:hypothetical protein